MYEINPIHIKENESINFDYFLEKNLKSNKFKSNNNNNNNCSNQKENNYHKSSVSGLNGNLIKTPITLIQDKEQSIESNSIMLSLRRRRLFQRHSCLISILIAFSLGLILGVLIPIISIQANEIINNNINENLINKTNNNLLLDNNQYLIDNSKKIENINNYEPDHPMSDFPTIYELKKEINENNQQLHTDKDTISVSFINNNNNNNNNDDGNDFKKLPVEEVFRNAFHLVQDTDDTMIVKKLDAQDGSIKEFRVQRTSDGLYHKGPERRISKPSVIEQVLRSKNIDANNKTKSMNSSGSVKEKESISSKVTSAFIKNDIYWGDLIENLLPKGFNRNEINEWNKYVHKKAIVKHLENGCGRMQNRLVIFNDGSRACARYRQNTDQIQGELFSFYLGQLLNLTNLAPSAASVIDLETDTWSKAELDIQQSQWKSQRPVVLTKWLPDLEPAGIPLVFQPLERHLNKFDVWNITLSMIQHINNEKINNMKSQEDEISKNTANQLIKDNGNNKKDYQIDYQNNHRHNYENKQKGLLERLGAANINDNQSKSADDDNNNNNNNILINDTLLLLNLTTYLNNDNNKIILNRLIELAQWSDLIIFDYLIANLDRVVNNLYNYQWNTDIMAAPAHNLARQINSQLLVFLDNESGLLHGYRLLKKYEAYHGLLLDNLCVFRKPTIDALKNLRINGVGIKLHELFEKSTSHQVRDVLPSLPDKSIKILIDRIDRVLGQVQKCRDLFSDR